MLLLIALLFLASGMPSRWKEAIDFLNEMVDEGARPKVFVRGCRSHLMILRGEIPDAFAYSALIEGFCLGGRIGDANDLFVPWKTRGLKLILFASMC